MCSAPAMVHVSMRQELMECRLAFSVPTATNAEILGKHGCVATLSKLLTRIGRKDLVLVQ